MYRVQPLLPRHAVPRGIAALGPVGLSHASFVFHYRPVAFNLYIYIFYRNYDGFISSPLVGVEVFIVTGEIKASLWTRVSVCASGDRSGRFRPEEQRSHSRAGPVPHAQAASCSPPPLWVPGGKDRGLLRPSGPPQSPPRHSSEPSITPQELSPIPSQSPPSESPHSPLETLRDLPHPHQNPPRATEVPSDPSQSHRGPLSPLPGSPRRPRPAPFHHILFLTQTNAIGRRTLPAPPGAPLYPPHPLSSPNHSSPSPPRLLLPPPSPPPFGVLHWTV